MDTATKDRLFRESFMQWEDAAYRRGVQDGRKQAADEVFAAIHAEEMTETMGDCVDSMRAMKALAGLRRRLSHLFLSSPPSRNPCSRDPAP